MITLWGAEASEIGKAYAWVLGDNVSVQSNITINDKTESYRLLAVHSGDQADAKTMINFTFTPVNGSPIKGIIIGNHIFVPLDGPIDPGQNTAIFNFSTSGGTVSINGTIVESTSNIIFDFSNPAPITVTSKKWR